MSFLGRALPRFYKGLAMFGGLRLAHYDDPKRGDLTRPTMTWDTDNPPVHSEVNGSSYLCMGSSDPRDLWWTRITGAWVRSFPSSSLVWYTGTITNALADSPAGVHAANGDDVQAWPGAFTSPAVPRNVTVTFEASWAGGNVTFTGTDQFDAVLTETIAASAGSRVDGIKTFKTVTGIAHAAAGPGGAGHDATAGWGHKFGVAQTLTAPLGVLSADGANDDAVWDSTYHAFIPTQLPDGAIDFTWAVPT